MTVNPKDRLESLRERIDEAEEIDPADQERLREFSDELYLRSSEYSDHRHEKLLRHCVIMAEQEGRLAESLENKRAAKHLVRWINQNYDNYETNRDYRLSIRVFGRILEPTEDGNAPESIEWIPSGTPSNYDPSPDPREMLDWEEEVVPMIQSCHNNRDRALIALAFDAGPRGGELKSLCVGDIQDGDHGLRVTLEGKQGRRRSRSSPRPRTSTAGSPTIRGRTTTRLRVVWSPRRRVHQRPRVLQDPAVRCRARRRHQTRHAHELPQVLGVLPRQQGHVPGPS